jgi:hypothetical protein
MRNGPAEPIVQRHPRGPAQELLGTGNVGAPLQGIVARQRPVHKAGLRFADLQNEFRQLANPQFVGTAEMTGPVTAGWPAKWARLSDLPV